MGWSVNEETRQWLSGKMLPIVYWHHQMHKTKNPGQRKRYQKACLRADKDFNADPFRLGLTSVTSNGAGCHDDYSSRPYGGGDASNRSVR